MAMFFLLDSIGQNASKTRGRENIVKKVGECLKSQIKYIIDSPDKENIPKVEKTITIWKARDIFSPDIMRSIRTTVESTKAKQNMTEEEKIMRKIEEIRRSQKLAQLKACLRVPNEDPFAEMEELTQQIEAQATVETKPQIRKLATIPEYPSPVASPPSPSGTFEQNNGSFSPEKLVGSKHIVATAAGAGPHYNPHDQFYSRGNYVAPVAPPSNNYLPGYPAPVYGGHYQPGPGYCGPNYPPQVPGYDQYNYEQQHYNYGYDQRENPNAGPQTDAKFKSGTKRQTMNTSTTYFGRPKPKKGNKNGKKKTEWP